MCSLSQAAGFLVSQNARRCNSRLKDAIFYPDRPSGVLQIMNDIELLNNLYDRFNARDISAILVHLHHDVAWANGMEGGHVYGHEGVREYWTRQWKLIDPHVEPRGVSTLADGTVVVEVRQLVRDLKGVLLSNTMVHHLFLIENDLIKRFDIQ